MLPGVSGTLVSGYFAEQVLPGRFAGEVGEDRREAARTAFGRWHRSRAGSLGPVCTARAVFDLAAQPLAAVLGYRIGAPVPVGKGELLLASLDAAGRRHPPSSFPLLLCAAYGEDLDATWREAVRCSAPTDAWWCLCVNGVEVRLVDTRRSYARRHLAFSVDALLDESAAFGLFWALCRPEAFLPGVAPPAAPPLIDRVAQASAAETVSVCRDLRAGVLEALHLLLHSLSGPRRRAGASARVRPAGLLEQSLTIVYRLLFLLFAESRELLPTWHPIYRDSYSMEAVRRLAERPGPARGLWETLQAISRLSHAGCRAGDLKVTPFNGRLFSPSLTPAAELPWVEDETARRVVIALCTSGGGSNRPRARITYRDLGVEQLGSVYESVLDYQVVRGDARSPARLEPGGGARKATGTFYTPQSITGFLVRRALTPLVASVSPEEILDLRVLDPAMGSGAFLVAACHFLAAAYEAALVRDARCRPGDVGDDDRRAFRRLVASRCLYGVDVNPTAVQLARLSLWLSTLAPDRPLTFLDHRLVVGDSLVGASLDDLARCPMPGAGRGGRHEDAPLFALVNEEGPGPGLRAVLPIRSWVASASDDNVAAVREKESLLASVSGASSPLARWKQVADAWCGLGLGLGSPGDASRSARPPAGLFAQLADHVLAGRSDLPAPAAERWLASLAAAAADRRFFHWTLEFPEVFFATDGTPRPDAGFDAVIGNPPWDVLRADNPGRDAEDRSSRDLVRFARRSGLYRAAGDGHANSFQLFLERAVRLVRRGPRVTGDDPLGRAGTEAGPCERAGGGGGRIAMVLPWGLASDSGCAALRRLLFDTCTLDSFRGFDNTDAVFPIHRSVRFLLLTATAGGRTESLPCRIGDRDPAVLDSDDDRSIVLTRALITRVSGDDLAIPDVRSPEDLSLLEKLVTSVPPLAGPAGWGVEFGRELNASDDRRHFTREPHGIPVLEGKHVQPFHADTAAVALRLPRPAARTLYARTNAFRRPRLAYRDVASATNRLTLIAAVVPADTATVHTLFCLRGPVPERDQWFLCGILNSFVANYLVRLRVTTHVTAGILARLPVPKPADDSPAFKSIGRLARELSALPTPEQDERYALLQASVAALYGLTQSELAHVLARLPLVERTIKEMTMTSFVDLAIW